MADIEKYPTEMSLPDKVHDLAQDLGIPLVGAILRQTIETPLRKRQNDWYNSLAKLLADHENRLRELAEKDSARLEEVISIISQSYIYSARSHLSEKRRSLLVAIEKAILTHEDFDLMMIYVRLVDELQPFHMALLTAYQDPGNIYDKYRSHVSASSEGLIRIEDLFEKSVGNLGNFVQVAVNDLNVRGLLDVSRKHRFVQRNITLQGSITDFGRSFVEFIKMPT